MLHRHLVRERELTFNIDELKYIVLSMNIGSFSYQFFTIGTYYYWSTPVDSSGLISLRGVITVVAAQPQTLTVQVTSGSFTAQSCVFPFTFNGVSYTSCTTTNDTQLWCSPSATYTGQRLYCTPSSESIVYYLFIICHLSSL